MNPGVLTKWPVAVEIDVDSHDVSGDGLVRSEALSEWFERARAAYAKRLAKWQVGTERIEVTDRAFVQRAPVACPGTVVVTASVTELREHSFEMRARIRSASGASGGAIVADGRWSMGLSETGTGERIPLPEAFRRRVFEVEAAAAHYG